MVNKAREQEDRRRKIVQRILKNVPYAAIGKEFNVTRQRIHQMRKQAERYGVKFPNRTRGRRRGEFVDEIVAKLQSDASYEQLSQETGFTQKQLQMVRHSATLRGVVIPIRRYARKRRVVPPELLKDLKDVRLSVKEVAAKHDAKVGSINTLLCRLRQSGEEIPYRGTPSPFLGRPTPWFSKRQRSNIERSVLNANLSISDIAEKHSISSTHAIYVIHLMRERGIDVPNRQSSRKEKSSRRLEIEKAIQSDAAIKEITERFGVTYNHVHYLKCAMQKEGIVVPRRNHKISRQKRADIKRACARGLTNASIARKYNVSPRTVGRIQNTE